MENIEIREELFSIGGEDYQIRSLKDLQQYSDCLGLAEREQITPTNWSHFGVVWPAGLVLARRIASMELQPVSMLELGCGLGLASLVASRRGADITASDYHPLVQSFLDHNADANGLTRIKYIKGDWRKPITRAGKFGLLIGSHLLYERQQPEQLAVFIDCHAQPDATVIICDPDRRQLSRFSRLMSSNGFSSSKEDIPPQLLMGKRFRGKILTYVRTASTL